MISNFFSIGDRNYLNNAVVISNTLDTITKEYGDVRNFKIQFRKPFLSQAEFKISADKTDGYITGQFDVAGTCLYFSYTPIDIPLEFKSASRHAVDTEITSFNVCYYITDICRGSIETGFEKVYGPMTTTDKVIFVIFEIPDTEVFSSIIKNQKLPTMRVTDAEQTGNRRFKISVYIGEKLLGHRHSTVKEFKV